MNEPAMPDGDEEAGAARRLRRGLVIVAGATTLGTAVELAFQHHWTDPVQLVAWAALVVLAVAAAVLLGRPRARAVRSVRLLVGVVTAAALLGFAQHVLGNYDAAPLDAVYGEQWETMNEGSKWWAAITQSVGPSPSLAPGVLALAALCLWLATLDHPALRTHDAPEPAGRRPS